MEICVDANLVVKWYTPEDLRDEAVALLNECRRLNIRIIAPDCLPSEAASTFRRKVHRGLIGADEGEEAVILMIQTQIDYVNTIELVPDAWCIAEQYN